MAFRNATEALMHSSRVICSEAKEAVARSVVVRETARATVRESRRIRASALILREEIWMVPALQGSGL